MPKTENLELLVERVRDLDGLSLWMPVNSDYEQGLAKKVFGIGKHYTYQSVKPWRQEIR